MMKLALAATLLAFNLFLAAAPTAEAATATLPQQFQHEGLKFFDPLTYSSAKTLAIKKSSIAFGIQKQFAIKNEKKKEALEKIIITPPITTKQHLPYPTQSLRNTIVVTSIPSPSPLPTQIPTPTPQPPTATTSTGGLNAEKLFSMANSYRQTKGLPPLQKDERACSLAASRAPEVANELATGTLHSGLQARNLPYWNTENIISMNSEEAAFNWWINDTIHRQAIEGNYTYSCVACSGNSCAQEFTNFQPK